MIGMRSPLTLIPLLFLGGFIAIIAAIAAIIITESTKKKKQNELRLKCLWRTIQSRLKMMTIRKKNNNEALI